jgi:lipopolysaccharide export LptBFGC system permease protein LptF
MAADTAGALAALDTAQTALDQAPAAAAVLQPWSQDLVQFLSLGVLGFSCIALLLAAALLWRAHASPHQVLRVFGVIAILGFSALLLVVGYNNEQLTPIVGLFGAIAGYLLGKDARSGKDE